MSKSEDGWEPLHAGPDILQWVTIPGCNPGVTLQLMKGWPLAIMRAFAADYNAYVEPLRDRDSAAFTPTNSVATSNHLNGTAMDLNWDGKDGKTFRLGISEAQAYPGDEARNLRDLIDFYEGNIFCGGNWSIRDWMHMQMGGNTWMNPATQDFINRKIRADGFSIYRRGNVPVPPALSRTDRYALVIISVGRELGITPRGICMALCVGLVETTDLKIYANSNDQPSLAYYHDAVGSDHMSVGVWQQQPPWGPLADRMTVSGGARIFFLCDVGPGVRGLLNIRDRDGNRYDYNDESRTPGFYCQKVQGSAYPDRYDARWNDAVALYNRLAGTPAPQPPATGGFLDMLNDNEQQELLAKTRALYQMFYEKLPSTSRYGDDSVKWDIGQLIRNMDGFAFNLEAEHNAALGQQWAIDQIAKKAAAGDAIAQAFLDMLDKPEVPVQVTYTAPAPLPPVSEQISAAIRQAPAPDPATLVLAPAPAPVYPPMPMALAHEPAPKENGDRGLGAVVKTVVDAVEQLNLGDALSAKEYATLDASIKILQMKNGSQ